MEAKKVLGQDHITKYFINAIVSNKISHAYIIEGPQGSGKEELAREFATALVCESEDVKSTGEPCYNCSGCKRAMSMNHPDIKYIKPIKKTMGVDLIRDQVNSDVGILPYSSQRKIYIIESCEKMTVEAQNSLLKTIEEPPEYVVFVLLTTNIDTFLETILSRCSVLSTKPIREDDLVKELCETLGVSEYDAKLAAAFSGGHIGKAKEALESEELIELRKMCISIFAGIRVAPMIKIREYSTELEKMKDNIDAVLEMAMLWYKDLLVFKSSGSKNNIVFKENIKTIEEESGQITFVGLNKIIESIEAAKTRLTRNVNLKRVIEMMLLQIKEYSNYKEGLL